MGFLGVCLKGFEGLKVILRVVLLGGWFKIIMLKYVYFSYKIFERKFQLQNVYICRVLYGFYMNIILKNSCLYIILEKFLKL